MNEETLKLFQTLTELPGAPGFEDEVRRYVRARMSAYTDEIIQDGLGSLFGVLRGEENGPKVMACGHLDEVGFLVTVIQDNGLLRFQPLGSWWSQAALAQQVRISTKNGSIPGVIGSIPYQYLDEAQRGKPVDIARLFIDIGAASRQQAIDMGIRPGLPAVPVCPFTPLAGGNRIMAKAWDNRFGVGLAVELLMELSDKPHPNVLYAGATAQEEVGMRGAQTTARLVAPDICYVLEAGPANDVSGDKDAFGRLGQGAALRILDTTIVTNPTLVEFIVDTAETNRIPYQYYVSPGATDAARIHLSGHGVPTAVIGVCARYMHSPATIIDTGDYAAAKELLLKLVQATDRTTIDTIRAYR